MKFSSFVILFSRDVKLSSWMVAELTLVVVATKLTLVVVTAELTIVVVEAELSLVVAAAELTAIVVAVTQVIAMVVVMTQVAAVVVAATKVATMEVTSPIWEIQILPYQTQCPTCTIGRNSQRSFQVSIHHSPWGIPACFYGGQVLPCP
jgi:hypothetical protein